MNKKWFWAISLGMVLTLAMPALVGCGSVNPTLSPTTTPIRQPGYQPSDEFVSSVSLMNNYSVSVEILEYTTGKEVSLTRGNPNFDEILRLLSMSTTKQTTLKTGTSTETGKKVMVQRTIPYSMGYIMTFELKNGREVKCDVTSDSIWFETDEAIYQASVSPDLYSLLKGYVTNTPSASTATIEFVKVTAPLTLDGTKPGTDIPQASIVYHWANGITEVYGADGKRIFVAKDSEAASLPHLSGPNGPFTSPATFIYQVPSGSNIGKEVMEGKSKVTRIHLGDKLMLIIITKSEDFPLGELVQIPMSPALGSYITNSENKSSEVLLQEVWVNKGISDKVYFNPWYGKKVNSGESILVVSGSIQNKHLQNKEIAMYAEGYDASGKQVAWTIDAAHIAGQIGLHVESREVGKFTLHMNMADSIKSIRIFANNYAVTPP